jgi:hypothetical protein
MEKHGSCECVWNLNKQTAIVQLRVEKSQGIEKKIPGIFGLVRKQHS